MIWHDLVKVHTLTSMHIQKPHLHLRADLETVYRDVLASDGAPEDALVPIGELYLQHCSEGRNGVSASMLSPSDTYRS